MILILDNTLANEKILKIFVESKHQLTNIIVLKVNFFQNKTINFCDIYMQVWL